MRRPATLAALAVITLAAGCSSPQTEPPKIPAASSESSAFASEEEAVVAAEKAFAEYLSVLNAVSQSGGEGVERLEHLVSASSYEDAKALAAELKQNRHRQTGNISFADVEFQQHFRRGDGEIVVVMTCIDYSAQEIVNADGERLELLERPERTLFQVTLEAKRVDDSTRLVVDEIESWNDRPC